MRITLRRLLLIAIAIVAVAFVSAGLAGNHQEGLRGVVGDVGWTVFILGIPVVIALAIATVVQSVVRRSRKRDAV